MQKYLEAAKSRCIRKYESKFRIQLGGFTAQVYAFRVLQSGGQRFRAFGLFLLSLCARKPHTPKLPEYFIMLNILNNSETKNSMGLRSQNNCSPQEVT